MAPFTLQADILWYTAYSGKALNVSRVSRDTSGQEVFEWPRRCQYELLARGILRFWQIGLTQSEGAQLAEVTVNHHSARDLFGYQIGLASQERMNTLRELYGVRTEAEEEGYPIPADVVVESAEHVLIELLPFCIQPFEVYPTPDGEVALDNSSAQGSVILLCEPAGTVLCLVNIGGEKEWKRFGSADNRDAVKYVRNKIVRIR